MRTLRMIGSTALALLLLGSSGAGAATLQPLGSFKDPIYVSSDPGNPQRLFVVERGGLIQQLEDGRVSTFADISSVVGCGSGGCTGERGLLSMAPAPDFRSSGRLYVDYANDSDGTIHIAELRAFGGTAAIGTLRDVLTIPHPEETHNGGQLQFGPDGHLYISTGDGGGQSGGENSQNRESLLGKILRIDPRQSGVPLYTVPDSNPFVGRAGRDEIWSYGLRDPFRFSFDRLTGDLTIGDGGQGTFQEVDYAPAPLLGAGANYGWDCREGFALGPAGDPQCATPPLGGFTEPVFVYPHSKPVGGGAYGCAIIGGYVARDPSLGTLNGRYVYGDHCSGEIRSLDLDDPDPFASDRAEIVALGDLESFGEDSCGRLYVVLSDGEVLRLVGAAPAICSPSVPPVIDRAPKALTRLGIKAVSRRVKRGKRATITAWASPCPARRGDPVQLWRGRHKLGTRHLDRVCSVRFRPRIGHRLNFRATMREDSKFLPAQSRRLTIRIRHVSPKR